MSLAGWFFVWLIAGLTVAPAIGRRLRRARKQQSRPVLYIVRDQPLDISEATRRRLL